MAEVETKAPSAFDQRLRSGEPLMTCTIEPPFKVVVTAQGMQLDAPCLQFNHTDALGVLRLEFTPIAARQLRDILNQLQFDEGGGPGTNTMQ